MRDLGEVIDDIGWGNYQVIVAVLLGCCAFGEGSSIAATASLLGSLQTEWGLSNVQSACFMSSMFAGLGIGTCIGGTEADKRGRKPVIIASFGGMALFSFLSAVAVGPYSMVSMRLLYGVVVGIALAPVSTMAVECASSDSRSLLFILVEAVAFGAGSTYGSVLVLLYTPDLESPHGEWRYVVAFAALPSLMLLPFVILLLQESPHYLIANGMHHDAIKVLRFMAQINEKAVVVRSLDYELALFEDGLDGPVPEPADDCNRSHASNDDGEPDDAPQVEVEKSVMNVMQMLMQSDTFRPLMFGGSLAMVMHQILLVTTAVGFPPIFASIGNVRVALVLLFGSLFDLTGGLITIPIISNGNIGFRECMQGCLGIFAFLIVVMVGAATRSGFFLFVVVAALLMKLTLTVYMVTSWMYCTEIFPSSIRCTAFSICVGFGRVAAVIGPIVWELAVFEDSMCGPHGYYWIAVGFLSIYSLYVVSTCLTVDLQGQPLMDAELCRKAGIGQTYACSLGSGTMSRATSQQSFGGRRQSTNGALTSGEQSHDSDNCEANARFGSPQSRRKKSKGIGTDDQVPSGPSELSLPMNPSESPRPVNPFLCDEARPRSPSPVPVRGG